MKYVPDATGDRHFADDLTVDRDDVDGLLSELDEYAVEQALQISENSDDDVEITVLTVGPEDAKDALRASLRRRKSGYAGAYPTPNTAAVSEPRRSPRWSSC